MRNPNQKRIQCTCLSFNSCSLVNIASNSKHRKSCLLYQKFRRIPRLNKCRINLHNCLIFQLGYWYWLFNHAWGRMNALIAYFDGEVNKLTLNKRKETIETDWFNTLIDSNEQQVFLYTYSWSQPTQLQKLSGTDMYAQYSMSIESPLFRMFQRSRASQTD